MIASFSVHPACRYGQYDHNVTINDQAPSLDNDYNVVPVPGGEFRWAEANGIYNFGIWYYDHCRRPGHGGLWSSRPAVLAALVLHEPVVQVSARSGQWECSGYAVKLADIKDQLPAGWTWEEGREQYYFVARPTM